MLTKVVLEGPLGEAFGREWDLEISSPGEALRMINANKPGVFNWVRSNIKDYPAYQVICQYESGREEEISEAGFDFRRKATKMTFVPVIEGAGGGFGRIVIGAAMVFAAFETAGGSLAWASPGLGAMGASFIMTGIAQLISPRQNPSITASYNFNGPVNTTKQGVPVPLIYGRCLVGSQTISAALVADQLPVNN